MINFIWIQISFLLHLLWIPFSKCQIYSTYGPHDFHMNPGSNDVAVDVYDGRDSGKYRNRHYEDMYEYKLEPIKPLPIIVECYTCHYSYMSHHIQGMPNCDEPFRKEGIPIVNCEGYCAITRTTIGNGEYMISRSCLRNCKNIYDPISSVECCYASMCNGERSDAVTIFRKLDIKTLLLLFLLITITQ